MGAEDVFAWREPPPSRTRKKIWEPVADKLRERPGTWALVATYKSSNSARTMAGLLQKGRSPGWTPGEFETVSRSEDGVYNVYARYVGPQVEEGVDNTWPMP